MIINWTGPDRDVKGVGRLNKGDKRDVPQVIGESLVRQGLATSPDWSPPIDEDKEVKAPEPTKTTRKEVK